MSAVFYNLTLAGLMVLMVKCGAVLVGEETIRARRIPWAGAGLLVFAVIGVVVQASWAGAMGLLDHDPGKQGWWRPLTAVFLQSGISGTSWNLMTLAVMAALAEWFWGRWLMVALFIAGALLPEHLDALVGAVGHSTDPRNFIGSSGATYFLSATLAGALLLRGPHPALPNGPKVVDRRQALALSLAVPAAGLLMWFAQANGHGLVSVEGFIFGAALWALGRNTIKPERDLIDPPATSIAGALGATRTLRVNRRRHGPAASASPSSRRDNHPCGPDR